MESFCFFVSCLIIGFFAFLFVLEMKGKINVSSMFGVVITYLFDFLCVTVYFYLYLMRDKEATYENTFIGQICENRFDIGIIVLVIICNIVTKCGLKNLCGKNDLSCSNRTYQTIMNGFIFVFLLIGLICMDLDLSVSVAILLLGNIIGFSIHTDDNERITKKDIRIFIATIMITVILIVLASIYEETLKQYEFYFLLPWKILIVASSLVLMIMVIHKKLKKREKIYINWIRRKVGHEKIILVHAGGCIFNEKGEVLLQCRGDCNMWGIPGGALELGETPEMAAVREVKEETGLDVKVGRLIGVYTDTDAVCTNGDKYQSVCIAYELSVIGGELYCDNSETRELKYFPINNTPKLFCKQHEEMLEDIKSVLLEVKQ